MTVTVSLPDTNYTLREWGELRPSFDPELGRPEGWIVDVTVGYDTLYEGLTYVVEESHTYILDPGNLPAGLLFLAVNGEIVTEARWEDLIAAREAQWRVWGHGIPHADASMTALVRSLDETGWYTSNWFGTFYTEDGAWIFHSDHGWLYDATEGHSEEWYYDVNIGWIYAEAESYPLIYDASREAHLLYLEGTRNPRWFFDFTAGEWLTRD